MPSAEQQDKQSQVEHGSILGVKTQNICHEETTKYSKYYLRYSLLFPLFTDYSSLKWKW